MLQQDKKNQEQEFSLKQLFVPLTTLKAIHCNGQGSYNFLVTGVDGGGIRIQITDPSNNNVVIYDTQPGAATTATPTTSVTGKVIVH